MMHSGHTWRRFNQKIAAPQFGIAFSVCCLRTSRRHSWKFGRHLQLASPKLSIGSDQRPQGQPITLSSFSRRLAHLLSFQFVALGDQLGERRLVRNLMSLGCRQQHSEHVRLEMRSFAGENALLCGLPPLGREQKPKGKRFYFLRGLV